MTSDGDQGIITYDTSVTLSVTNDQFEENAIYVIQVVAVNAIGQGPVSEATLSECLFDILFWKRDVHVYISN